MSTDDSFKKNRRFSRLAPTILLLRIDDSFSSHRGCLEKSIYFISKRSHFLLSPDSFSLHQRISRQLDRSHTTSTDTCHKTLLFLVDKTFISNILNPGNLQGRAKICACSLVGRASMRRSLFLDWHPARKKQ